MLFSWQNEGGNIGLLNKLFTSKTTSKSGDIYKDGERISASSFLFANTIGGKNADEFTIMHMTAVYSCVRVFAESLTGLTIYLLLVSHFILQPIIKDIAFVHMYHLITFKKNYLKGFEI